MLTIVLSVRTAKLTNILLILDGTSLLFFKIGNVFAITLILFTVWFIFFLKSLNTPLENRDGERDSLNSANYY